MPDIFDTSISEGRNIQQSIGEPSITPQSRGASVEISAEDTFNLRAGTRISQLKAQSASKQAAREAQRARETASRNLDNLSKGLINRHADIDSRITNPVERNRLKREADLVALSTGGKENATFINQIIGRLKTKREARDDGMVNILGANGELIGVEAGSRDAVLKGRLDAHKIEIDSVFPNTLESLSGLIQTDAAQGNHIQESTVSEILINMKNASKRMKSVSDDFHVNSNQLPSSQLPALTKNATSGYLKSIGNVFNSFTSSDFMKGIRAGDLSRSDIDIAMQQVRRDMVDEITSQGVPINIRDMETYITESIDNIKASYDKVQKNDLVSLQVEADKTRLVNEITGNKFNAAHKIPEIRGAKEVADYTASIAASLGDLTDAALFAEEDTKATLEAVATGQLNTLETLIPVHDNVNKHIFKSQFDLEDFSRDMKTMTTRADVLRTLAKVGKVTRNVAGSVMLPYVRTSINESAPNFLKAVDDELITQEELETAWDQLEQYDIAAVNIHKKAGMTDEEAVSISERTFQWFSDTYDWFFPPASNERIEKKTILRQRGQSSLEVQ